MTRQLDPEEARHAFSPLVGDNVLLHNVDHFALLIFQGHDHQDGPGIGVSITFVGTWEHEPPDVTFVLTLDQAQSMVKGLKDLRRQIDQCV